MKIRCSSVQSRSIFIVSIMDMGMLKFSAHHYLVCSQDAVALVKAADALMFPPRGIVIFSSMNKNVWIVPVEIKTKLAQTTLGGAIIKSRADPAFCDVGDKLCRDFVASKHLAQLVQKEAVINSNVVVYIVAS